MARYLRDYLELTGTKVSCNQSGCGACTVTAEIPDPNDSNSSRTKSVNSVSIIIWFLSILALYFNWLQFLSFCIDMFFFSVHYSGIDMQWMVDYNSRRSRKCEGGITSHSGKAIRVPWNPMWILHPWNGDANE